MKSEGLSQSFIFYVLMKDFRKDPAPRPQLQFVTSLSGQSSVPRSLRNGIILGIGMVNVLLGSWDGEASQVVVGLGVLGIGLVLQANFLRKRRSRLYENDPHSGKNET